MYNPFNPFWGYYDSFYGYGNMWGYGYGNMWGYGYNSWYRNFQYSQNWNTPVSLINGRRGSRNSISSRSLSINNSRISDRFNRSASSSLNNRLNRIDKINNAARINPNYYNKPFSSNGSSNSLSKPNSNNSKPSGNNEYSRPSNNYKPANSGYSPSNNSRSNYSSPSNSSFSRGSSSSSSRGSSSRGGKIG
jgi:uncharacterized membrane protein YgcG